MPVRRPRPQYRRPGDPVPRHAPPPPVLSPPTPEQRAADRARDKRIRALAIPALATLAVEPIYVLTDTAIVGRALGTSALGGLALASTVLSALVWSCNFLSFGTTSRVALLTGRGRHREAAASAAQGLWLAVGVGLLLLVVVGTGAGWLARALGGEGEVLDAATTYLRISAIGVPFILIPLVGQGYLRGRSDTRTPLRIVLLGNLANLGLELLFVYGFGWGVAGSAWSTVIAQAGVAAVFAVLLGRRVRDLDAPLRPNGREIRGLVVVGRHMFLRTGALLAALTLSTSTAARIDAPSLAGHHIALQLFTFLALVVDSLAIAAQAMIGTLLGAGDRAEVRATGHRLMRMSVRVGVGLAVVVCAASDFVPAAFSQDERVLDRAVVAVLLLGLLQIPAAIAFTLDGILMGASDFRFLQWTTITALAAFVPVAVLVTSRPELGLSALWSGLILWMSVRAAVSWVRYQGDRWMAVSESAAR